MEDLLSVESLESFVQTFHENVNQLKVLKQSKVLDEAEAEQKSAGMKTGGGAEEKTEEDDDAITEVNVGNFAQTIAEATETRSGTKFYFFLKKDLDSRHSSEIGGLRSTKCSSETIQNLLYFMYKKIHVLVFVFHFMQLYVFTL